MYAVCRQLFEAVAGSKCRVWGFGRDTTADDASPEVQISELLMDMRQTSNLAEPQANLQALGCISGLKLALVSNSEYPTSGTHGKM